MRSQTLSGRGDVVGDLGLQRVEPWELSLLPEPTHQPESHLPAVQRAREVQHVRLDDQRVLSERGPDANVHHRGMTLASDVHPARVHPGGNKQLAVRSEIRRGKAQRPSASRALYDLAHDRIVTAEIAR